MSLAQLSFDRIGPSLESIVQSFAPGEPLPTRLLVGRDRALARIQKHVPSFKFSPSAATDALREVDAWATRNDAALSQMMASSATDLPAQLQLQMGPSRAKAFILASFTAAAAGLGPWASGAVASYAAEGEVINERWARSDAQQRLEMFALIVKLDDDGNLAPMLAPPSSLGGYGALGAVPWLVVIALVVLAAAVVTTVVLWRRLELNNRLLRDICDEAQRTGDQKTVAACIEATKGLQASPLEAVPAKIAYAFAGAGLVYLGLRFGLPLLEQHRRVRS